MHRSTILALAFATANASALLTKRQDIVAVTSTAASNPSATPSSPSDDSDDSDDSGSYATGACFPNNATGSPDFNAPCNQIKAIEAQCSYGPPGLDFVTQPADSDNSPDFNDPQWQQLSPETERTCICQSQILDATLGCLACMKAHQVPVGESDLPQYDNFTRTMIKQYCDVSFTPSTSFIEFAADAQEKAFGPDDMDDLPEDESPSSSITSDPLGSSTAVSLYYTMSITRSDAYDLAVPTPSSSGANVIYTSTRISDGEIVPTAVNDAKAQGSGEAGGSSSSGSGSKDGASTTSSADSGAATAQAGAAGLLAIAALAAVGL